MANLEGFLKHSVNQFKNFVEVNRDAFWIGIIIGHEGQQEETDTKTALNTSDFFPHHGLVFESSLKPAPFRMPSIKTQSLRKNTQFGKQLHIVSLLYYAWQDKNLNKLTFSYLLLVWAR